MTERAMGVTRACGLVGISRSLLHYESRRRRTGGMLVKKDVADTVAKNAIQPFKVTVADVGTSASTPQTASKASTNTQTAHSADLTSINLSIANLQGSLIAAAKSDFESSDKIKARFGNWKLKSAI
nr:hypothetical protein [Burkholderia ubonensis]